MLTVLRRSQAKTVDLCVLLAGAVSVCGFAPLGIWPLPVLTLAVLFWALRGVSPRRGLIRGFLFGLGLFGAGVSWVVESFQYSHVALSSAVILTTLMVLVLSLYPALFGWLTARFEERQAGFLLLGMPALWVLSEWARGTVLTGFSFLQLAYSQTDSPLSVFAPIAGVYGTGWVLALASASLAWFADEARARWKPAVVTFAAVAVLLLGVRAIPLTSAEPTELDVAVVQANIPQALKWRPELRERTLEIYVSHTRRHWDADFIIWPETALPGLRSSFSVFLDELDQESRRHGTELLIGVPTEVVVEGESSRYYNSVISVGGADEVYNKRHLVPFGEYVPLQAVFQPLIDLFKWPVSSFTHGDPKQTTLQVAGHTVGITICFESAFGKDVMAALPEAALLVNVSNDAWFGKSLGPHQHLQIARWRALEAGRSMIRATNTGITAFIDHDGRVVSSIEDFKEASLRGTVQLRSGVTPYVRISDWPILVLALIATLGAVVRAAGMRDLR